MKIFVSAGDVSGDRHAAMLIKELRSLENELEIYGIGGDELVKEGAQIFNHLEDISVVGFGEVLGRLPAIIRAKRRARRILRESRPDVLLLVNYPGFNLPLARDAHRMGIVVVYYIPPQVWAWGRHRIKYIKRWVDKVIVILPFEEDFYKRFGIKAYYVGHPLLDEINRTALEEDYISLLPGSRMGEIKHILPLLLSVSKSLPNEKFIIPLSSHKHIDYVLSLVGKENPSIHVKVGSTYEVLSRSKLAIAASGTITLECAIIGVPLIIVYKVSPITWFFARALVDVPYAGLVNLIANKEVAPEYLQSRAKTEIICRAVEKILGEEKQSMKAELERVEAKLGGRGASKKAAEILLMK